MTERVRSIASVLLAATLASATATGGVLAQTVAANPVSDKAVDAAVDQAIEYLWTQQEPSGLWPYKEAKDNKGVMRSITGSRWPPGEHTMVMMALEYANVPADDERFQKGLKLLMELDLDKNYMISIRVVTLAHLYHRSENDKKPGLRAAMKEDVGQLVANQGKIGGWRYGGPPIPPRAIDFSNTQLVVLALSEAAKCGVELPQEAMIRVHKRIIEDQREDGGWNYGCYGGADVPDRGPDEPSYGNMTAACVASLYLTDEFLTGGIGCPCRNGRSGRGKDIVGDVLQRGMEWLNREFLPDRSPKGYHYFYWIYQAERVGIATGYRYFGAHDWYREVCANLLPKQGGDGHFGANVVDTSFAILFLVKGRAPILYNKLQYDGDWNLHHYDLPNLTTYIGRAKEQPIAWQVLQSTTPLELWYDAPVLFITTEEEFKITDELKQKLRRYTDGGGTLLVEASCGHPKARVFWTKLVKEVWPEWELERVDNTHPLWEADVPVRGRRPNLMHIDDGIRSFLFYSPADVSCTWHMFAVTKQAPWFDLGMNLPAYASDRAPLRARLSGPLVRTGRGLEGNTLSAPKGAIRIGRLKHGGDWYVGRNYLGLERLAEFLKAASGLAAEVADEVDASGAALRGLGLLWMIGRKDLRLSDEGRASLKAWLAHGGFLVVESVMGDPALGEAVKTLAADLGLTIRPLDRTHPLISGTFEGATGFNLSEGVRFSRALKTKRIGQEFAALTGLYLGERLVGVWSPYDILYSLTGCPAYDRLGYEPDHAMALGTNLVLQAAVSKVKPSAVPGE